jgi:hypothetical protein
MNKAEAGIHSILVDFYNLSKNTLRNEDSGEVQLRTKNRSILKSFLICAELCFQYDIRDKYTDAVKNYFSELEQAPINGLQVSILIGKITSYLQILENSRKYKMYLKILDEYIHQ